MRWILVAFLGSVLLASLAPLFWPGLRGACSRALRWGGVAGGVGFALFFFGPALLAPSSNQAPLLGIFVTGPIGFVAGALVGFLHALLYPPEPPSEADVFD